MRYTVRVIDQITEEYVYTVEADSRDAAREEAEELHLSNPVEPDDVAVTERDVLIEEEQR